MWYIHAIEYSALKENETTQRNLEGIVPSKILISHTEKGNYRMPLYMCRIKETGQTKVKVTQSCPNLRDPMGYTDHGTVQAGILEWVAMLSSRESSQPRDRTQVFCIAGRLFTI